MKKLLFAVAIIGVLVGSTLGGIALADKPEGVPVPEALAEIDQKTEDIQATLYDFEAEMDNISRTEAFEGSLIAWKGSDADDYTFDEIRHISISFYVRGTDSGDDVVDIGGNFGGYEPVKGFYDDGLHTYELNASDVHIDAIDWAGDSVEVYYYMVTTYSPSECYGEGEAIPVIPDPPDCCAGLDLIPPMDPGTVGIIGICTANCGDGICDPETETAYNCPEDCGG